MFKERVEMDKYKNELFEFGYCVIPNIISKEHINTLRDLYLSTFNDSGLVTLKPSSFLKQENIANIIFSDNVTTVIENIVGKKFCIYPDFTIRKSLYIPWHTDTSYLSISDTDSYESSDMVQMSIYLQDNDDAGGGGLEIIPGSHRFKNINRRNLSNSENNIDYEKAVLMPSKAGGLVFWDSRLIHRSSNHTVDGITKFGVQWTISKTENFSKQYINYLMDRVLAKQKHVSDNIGSRESDYLLGIKEVQYPGSFSEAQLNKIKEHNLKIKTL